MKKFYAFLLAILIFNLNVIVAQPTYTWTGKPMFNILTKRAGVTIGNIVVELFPKIAPYHTRNFDSLVSKQFFDTTAFHRVVPGFVIQGGDPNSRHGPISTWGTGQPGQPTVKAEFTKAKHLRGILSAARSSNINSATSQFFICVATAANLDGNYSVYGRVLSGMTFVDNIVASPITAPSPSPYYQMPLQKIEMFVTYIGSNDSIAQTPALITPTNNTLNVDTLNYTVFKWSKGDGIIYTVEFAYDSLFTAMDTTFNFGTNQVSYNGAKLFPLTKYYWRVKSNNGGKIGNYSQVWNFTTVGPPPPPNLESVRENLMSSIRVYPNPSNGKIFFKNVEIGAQVDIYNNNGKLIFTKKISSSTDEADLSSFPKGVYAYTILKESTIISKGKLILK